MYILLGILCFQSNETSLTNSNWSGDFHVRYMWLEPATSECIPLYIGEWEGLKCSFLLGTEYLPTIPTMMFPVRDREVMLTLSATETDIHHSAWFIVSTFVWQYLESNDQFFLRYHQSSSIAIHAQLHHQYTMICGLWIVMPFSLILNTSLQFTITR